MPQTTAKPVYVLHGTDAFIRDELRGQITRNVLGQADPQICTSRFDAAAELPDVLDELRTLPFLGNRRLVIVDDADEFVSRHRDGLEKYLAAPSPTGTLVLIVASFPAGTRLYKVVQKVGLAMDCHPPKPAQVGALLRKRAKSLGRSFEPAALELLIQWVGPDMARACAELDKLVLYTDGRDTVTARDVGAVVVATAGGNPFALTDALTAGDAQAALAPWPTR